MTASAESTCLFCRIAGGQLGAHFVYESERVVAFLDIRPVREGHIQVVARQHYPYFDDLPREVVAEILSVAQRLAPALRNLYGVPRVAFLFTGGDIAHAHAHVVPMVEATDITSPQYIAERPLTFREARRVDDGELARVAASLVRTMAGNDV